MTEITPTPDMLRDAVSELVAQCRAHISEGTADVTEIYRGVEAYCEAVAMLSTQEGKRYTQQLEEMMEEMNELKAELVAARDEISQKIASLGRMRHANIAYQKSDSIGEKKIVEDPDS